MSSSKIVLLAGLLAASLVSFYPPYHCVGIHAEGEIALGEGYYFLLAPPRDQHFNTGRSQYTIAYQTNFSRLSGIVIFISLASTCTATVLYTIKKRRAAKEEPLDSSDDDGMTKPGETTSTA